MQDRYTPVSFHPAYSYETQKNRCERLLREYFLKSEARLGELRKQHTNEKPTDYQSLVAHHTTGDDIHKINRLKYEFRAWGDLSSYSCQESTFIEILARLNQAFDDPQDEANKQQLYLLINQKQGSEINQTMLSFILQIVASTPPIALLYFAPNLSPLMIVAGMIFVILGFLIANHDTNRTNFQSGLQYSQQNINKISFFSPKPFGLEAYANVSAAENSSYNPDYRLQ